MTTPETEAALCARLRAEAPPIPDGLYVCRCDHSHPPDAGWCYVCEYPTREVNVMSGEETPMRCVNCNGEINHCRHGWTHVGGSHECLIQPEPKIATPKPKQGWTR